MRYRLPGFDSLTLSQKKLIYYLSEAAHAGRDIIYDQNYKYNLVVRKTLEEIYKNYHGNRNSDNFKKFEVYLKRIWFSNGIHHHYSNDKINPGFDKQYFNELVYNSEGADLPLKKGQKTDEFVNWISVIICDPDVAPRKVVNDPDKDVVAESAVNFYENVKATEVTDYYERLENHSDETTLLYGLNSKLVKENNSVFEKTYKLDGLYGQTIEKIIYWLEKARTVAENENQEKALEKLINYYKTGDLRVWDEFNILWLNDGNAAVDYVNGFIETYDDPLDRKATWESIVDFTDKEATKRAQTISNNAQWFEDHSPVDPRFKKNKVKGVTAKVITVAQLGGACYPATPVGINLPNSDWIRKEHGSKSVTLNNITYAYDQVALGSGFLEEFAASQEEIERARKYGTLAGNVHTDLHECLGHGSGQLLSGTDPKALRYYGSPLEEARADLFALYYIMDQKMLDLKVLPNIDASKAMYDGYIRNGLMTQLIRIEPGKDIEQAHMRNRQLIAKWCYEQGKKQNVIEIFRKKSKTYVRINDYAKLKNLIKKLLIEVQRIKSEGDYDAGKEIVEKYAVKFNRELHREVLKRYRRLNLAPYGGFINPKFIPVYDGNEIIDVKFEYPESYTKQMLQYSKKYSFLPV